MKRTHKALLIVLLAALMAAVGLFAASCDKKITLSFDTAGGESLSSLKVTAGEEVTLPDPYREGYAFEGWLAGGELLKGAVTAPQENTTYRAQWAEGYLVTLETDGGQFPAEPKPLYVKADADLYTALQGYVPTKRQVSFGAWFLGETEISPSSGVKMPREAITLTARYQTEYTLEIYLQNTNGNSYRRSEEDTSYSKDYVGKELSPEGPSIAHFVRNDEPASGSPVTTLTLEAGTENTFRFYYDRMTYTVDYAGGSPSVTGKTPSASVRYGRNYAVSENSFSREGYRFAGWSVSPEGDVDYLPGAQIAIEDSLLLYAVWDRGFTDRYGSDDLIFFPRTEENKAYLARGEKEFEGTRDGDSFRFETEAGVSFDGKVYRDTLAFSYARTDLAGNYVFFKNTPNPAIPAEEQYEEDHTLFIDNYMNAVYTAKGGTPENGSVRFSDSTGDYLFEGERGTVFHFLVDSNENRGSNVFLYDEIFCIGGEEEGAYTDFYPIEGMVGVGYPGYNTLLVLDGYRTVALLDAYYTYEFSGSYYVERTVMFGSATVRKIVCYLQDDYGILTGGTPGTVRNVIYTVPIETAEGYGGYVGSDAYAGEYSDGEGGTLVLDGLGLFDDSAVYTKDGEEVRSSYLATNDIVNGTVVTISEGSGERSFALDTANSSFAVFEHPVRGFTEYRLMAGEALTPPFLLLYDEAADVPDVQDARKAELWMPLSEDGDMLCAAKGYVVTKRSLGDYFTVFSFVRQSLTAEFAGTELPQRFDFYTSQASSSETGELYQMYIRLSVDDDSFLEVIRTTDGGEIWWNSSVTTNGIGSLYLPAYGSAIQGSFARTRNESFGYTEGTFSYQDEDGSVVILHFELSTKDDGSTLAKPVLGTEQMLYVVTPEAIEEQDLGREVLFLDGEAEYGGAGRARHTDNRGASYNNYTYEAVGMTESGETIYALRSGESEVFRFVIYTLPGDNYEGTYFATRFDTVLSGDFAAQTGHGSLYFDGYHRARYTTDDGTSINGNYRRDALGSMITFTEDGSLKEHIFLLDRAAGTFTETDWATYRTWDLLDNNYEPVGIGYQLSFDGNGNVLLYNNAGEPLPTSATYVVLPDYVHAYWGHEEYLLFNLNIGEGEKNYRVTFGTNEYDNSACYLHNDMADGVFIDENWNVLSLDGYSIGTLVTDTFTGNGTYEVVDFDENFIAFTVTDANSTAFEETFYVLLDKDTLTFSIADYEAHAGLYFAEDLSSVSFHADGTAHIGNESGPYFIRGNEAHVYLGDRPTIVPLPEDGSFAFGGKTYRFFPLGSTLTATGSVVFYDEEGEVAEEYPAVGMTLSFEPDGNANRRVKATVTFESEDYPENYEFTLTAYNSEGEISPVLGYGNNSYPIAIDFLESGCTFTVTGGYNSVEYLDHNERYYRNEPAKDPSGNAYIRNTGGRIFKSNVGFGPIVYQETEISGEFLYLYDSAEEGLHETPITFSGVPEKDVIVVGKSKEYGERKELVFNFNGTDYCFDYFEYYQGGIYFFNYGLFTYEDIETDGYTVRVKYLQHSHLSISPGYTEPNDKSPNPAVGKAIGVTLFDGEGQPVPAYDSAYTLDGYGKAVWLVPLEGVSEADEGMDTCTWGTGYLIRFEGEERVTSVSVEKYSFVQVVNYTEHLFNLFVSDDGDVLLVGFAVFYADMGRYDWVVDPTQLTCETSGSSHIFRFEADCKKKHFSYEVTVTAGEPDEDERPTYTATVKETPVSP